jgi:methylthioribose-1-phosphate isomerase
LPNGSAIAIEERAAEEVTTCGAVRTAPEGMEVYDLIAALPGSDSVAGLKSAYPKNAKGRSPMGSGL